MITRRRGKCLRSRNTELGGTLTYHEAEALDESTPDQESRHSGDYWENSGDDLQEVPILIVKNSIYTNGNRHDNSIYRVGYWPVREPREELELS